MEKVSPRNRLFNHPNGLLVFTVGEFWDRFSFYGTLTLLILYLTQTFSFPERQSYTLWGEYCALGFITPVLGGFIADKWLGLFRTALLGGIMMIFGFVFLTLSTHKNLSFLYLGLSLSTLGIGLFKGNISSLVGALYHKNDSRRDSGFTLFTMGMVSGAMLGPLVYGILAQEIGWNIVFELSAIGISLNLIWLWIRHKNLHFETLPPIPVYTKSQLLGVKLLTYVAMITATIGISILLSFPDIGNILLAFFSLLLFVLIGQFASRLSPSKQDAQRLLIIILLNVMVLVYYAASFQANGSIVIFIAHYVDTTLVGVHIPAAVFSSLESLFMLLFSPLVALIWQTLTARNINFSISHKIILGLGIAMIAFFAFALAPLSPYKAWWIAWSWLLVGNILLGVSGILITPTLMSLVSRYSHPRAQGTMMGLFFLTNALSGFIGGYMAGWGKPLHAIATQQSYNTLFLEIAGAIFISMIAMIIMTPFITRTLEGTEPCQKEKVLNAP